MNNPQASAGGKIGVRMHGVSLVLESNHRPLIDYAAEHLHGLVEKPAVDPDLMVKCYWSQGDWDPEENPFASDGELNVIGKRMLGNAGELIWLDTLKVKGLQLCFRHVDGRWIFEVAYRFHPKKEKLESLPEYEYKKYFSLMSYLVYYPLIWYLETFSDWTILHASALATERGGIMIGGLGGVGKTTTCIALMQRPGISLISENIIFTDGDFIYPCYEPIRLDEDSLKMLGENPAGLIRMRFPEGLKEKWMFHLDANRLPEKVKPAILLLPQFSSMRYMRPLSPEIAAEKTVAMNRLTRELDDYGWYASALNMHWPGMGQGARGTRQGANGMKVSSQFAQRARCFEMGIDRAAGVEAVVEDILNAFS